MPLPFKSLWLLDYEYRELEGNLVEPWCAVAKNLFTAEVRVWRHTDKVCRPIYDIGPRDVVVAYAAESEGRCCRRLGWPLPQHCVDLLPIFRRLINRFGSRSKASLLDALKHFNLPGISGLEKEEYRALAIRGAPFTEAEMDGLVAYCKTDVEALEALFPKLIETVDIQHALLMGRYTMVAVSGVQYAGVPVNHVLLTAMVENQAEIAKRLTVDIDKDFGVYVDGSFIHSNFESFLQKKGMVWPRTLAGRLQLSEDTFKELSLRYPCVKPLAELRKSLATFRAIKPSLGADGRNRVALMPFSSITGRNQPRGSGYVFAWPKWMRNFIQAPEGRVLISFDYEQQEFLIGAALAQDRAMMDAYHSGDPYLHMAKLSRAIPPDATKDSHRQQRDLYKTLVLSIQYGTGLDGLSAKLGDRAVAKKLSEEHRHQFRRYHSWCEQQVERVLLGESLTTPFGWAIRKSDISGEEINPRSVGNWPVQATGSDILRIAAISLVERNITVVALVHDALVVECAHAEADDVVRTVTGLMEETSMAVLSGERCRVEATVSAPGGGWADASPMFEKVTRIIQNL
ncbi:MAG: DNA polymerase [Verrucomicrobiota bacterium]